SWVASWPSQSAAIQKSLAGQSRRFPDVRVTSASLIGRWGSSAFRLSTTAVVDVARGLVLLYGIGTSALPSWDPRMGRSNLMGGLAGSGRQAKRTCELTSSILPPRPPFPRPLHLQLPPLPIRL